MIQEYYPLFEPQGGGSLQAQLAEIEAQTARFMAENSLSPRHLLMTRVYLSDAANCQPDVENHKLTREVLNAGFVSYVEQPPLSGCKVALQQWWIGDDDLQKSGTPDRLVARLGELAFYFQSVRFASGVGEDTTPAAQMRSAFLQHQAWLDTYGLNVADHCHRTWIFVRDVDREYAAVVKSRNEYFSEIGLTKDTHFISSTGIGGASRDTSAAVAADFFSVSGVPETGVKYLQALDHLNHTHEYGVAFERGTALDLPLGRHLLISGTASIDRFGQCLYRGDAVRQTERLMENIEALLRDGGASLADMQYMVCYLRDLADYPAVKACLAKLLPSVPCLMTLARVCRPEWLVEIEGIAVRR